nr:hypothetical protein [Lentilactobacillus sp. Marseille-Q4993]
MSLIPVSTAWAGKFIDKRAPEYFYIFIFILWSIMYLLLTREIINELEQNGQGADAKRIRAMTIYRFLISWKAIPIHLFMLVAIYFFPPSGLIITFIELVYMALHTTSDSDKIFE